MKDEEKQQHYERAEQLLAEQNFAAAVIGGAVAMLLAAVAYGITVAKWAVVYGFLAAVVGIVIGLAMQFLGRGISMRFSVVATVYTIAGCILGNLFAVVMYQAIASGSSPIDVLRNNPVSALAEWAVYSQSPIHLVYWFVAVVAAVFLAKRPLSRADRLAIGLHRLRG